MSVFLPTYYTSTNPILEPTIHADEVVTEDPDPPSTSSTVTIGRRTKLLFFTTYLLSTASSSFFSNVSTSVLSPVLACHSFELEWAIEDATCSSAVNSPPQTHEMRKTCWRGSNFCHDCRECSASLQRPSTQIIQYAQNLWIDAFLSPEYWR